MASYLRVNDFQTWIVSGGGQDFVRVFSDRTYGIPRPSFGLIVHHTDAEREYAYDAKPKSSGKLVTALAAASKMAGPSST